MCRSGLKLRLLKSWVAEAGFDPKKYGIESLRRTKALHILNSTGDLETVRVLLGHEKIESTSHYLSIGKGTKSDPIAISRAFGSAAVWPGVARAQRRSAGGEGSDHDHTHRLLHRR
jgi:hypothetical protein